MPEKLKPCPACGAPYPRMVERPRCGNGRRGRQKMEYSGAIPAPPALVEGAAERAGVVLA